MEHLLSDRLEMAADDDQLLGMQVVDNLTPLDTELTSQQNEWPPSEFDSSVDNRLFNNRRQTIRQMVKDYANDPEVIKSVKKTMVYNNAKARGIANGEIGSYIIQASQYPFITAKEARMLFRSLDKGIASQQRLDAKADDFEDVTDLYDDVKQAVIAYQKLVLANTGLVIKIASDYRSLKHVDMLDHIQNGNIGLMEAIETFDPDRGSSFSSYARILIRGAINRGINSMFRTIRVTHEVLFLAAKVQDRLSDLESQGEKVTIDKLVEDFRGRYSAQYIKYLLDIGRSDAISFSQLSDYTIDKIADPDSSFESDAVDRLGNKDMVNEILNSSDIQVKVILSLRYVIVVPELIGERISSKGLNSVSYNDAFAEAINTGGLTFEQVGKIMGLSKQRIQQIEAKAAKQIRTMF